MERRLLLVFALTFVIILLLQPLIKKMAPPPPAKTQESQTAQNQPAQTQGTPGGTNPSATTEPAGKLTATTPKQAAGESETVIDSDLYHIVFTNRGAQVKSWVLKKYTDEKGNPLELVNRAASEKFGYPLSLWSYDEGLRNKLNSALYVVQSTGSRAPAEVSFEYADGDVVVRKNFKFDQSYVLEVHTSVAVKGTVVSAFPMWPSGFGDDTTLPSFATSQIVYQSGSRVERLAAKKVSGGATISGPFAWGGVSDQYFAAVLIPDDPPTAALVTLRNALNIPKDPSHPEDKQTVQVDLIGAAVGNLKGPTDDRLYIGPKSLPDLEAVRVPGITGAEPDLRALIDFGWLGVIARPLFIWLKWTYNHMVANWGWAIVVQTIIINLAILPLRLSSMKSMLKMQRVAPQIKSIQEKYKKYSLRDPRKAEMNEEISALYKKEGVNPVGGCLPMLLPLFLLWPYYRMLTVAIDLRQAPWLWIHDLSATDPLHILPIGIIITMLFMQRMTPQAGMDPAQQKMMNIMMPGMMGVISWNLSAGLCLYWSMGNLIGIVQQSMMNRTALGREMREMMEKRARKKDK